MLRPLTVACALALVGTASGCTLTEPKSSGKDAKGTITVSASADACEVSTTKVSSGNLVFSVKNAGSQVTEFYLYGEDGMRIVGEVENVGPGLTRDLVVNAAPGKYVTACKPGMKGEGIRDDFTVTGSGTETSIKGVDQTDIDKATADYGAYVRDQAGQLVEATTIFNKAYLSGRDDEARKLFPHARGHWERIEPVAESFGDLDPKMDLREADLEPGQRWTGWHRIEKDLWHPSSYNPMSQAQRKTFAEDLLANTKVLDRRVQKMDLTVDQIGNGSKELLDEVAAGKITGEEDIWSHTDLYDFQANVDGARVAYEVLKPILGVKNPKLDKQIGTEFTKLQKLLDQYRVGNDDFVFYDKVTEAQRKELSNAVNALAEPLSKMTGAVVL